MIRIFGFRISGVRKFHGFKRAVVPSDFAKQTVSRETDVKRSINEKEFEKKGNKAGRDLYYLKYGGSIYGGSIYDVQTIFKSFNDLDEVRLTNTTNFKIGDKRSEYDDEYERLD
jgi:hypothetical protein